MYSVIAKWDQRGDVFFTITGTILADDLTSPSAGSQHRGLLPQGPEPVVLKKIVEVEISKDKFIGWLEMRDEGLA